MHKSHIALGIAVLLLLVLAGCMAARHEQVQTTSPDVVAASPSPELAASAADPQQDQAAVAADPSRQHAAKPMTMHGDGGAWHWWMMGGMMAMMALIML